MQLERAGVVALVRTLDIALAFILQLLFLDYTANVYSIVGAALVLGCNIMVILNRAGLTPNKATKNQGGLPEELKSLIGTVKGHLYGRNNWGLATSKGKTICKWTFSCILVACVASAGYYYFTGRSRRTREEERRLPLLALIIPVPSILEFSLIVEMELQVCSFWISAFSFAETSLYLREAGEREKESAQGRWEGEEIKRGTRRVNPPRHQSFPLPIIPRTLTFYYYYF